MTAEPIKVSPNNLIAVVKFKFECMFVFCFFSNSFVKCHKEIGFFLQYCLSYGVAVTKNYFVGRTESLQQMDFLFVALSQCDKQNWYMLLKNAKMW